MTKRRWGLVVIALAAALAAVWWVRSRPRRAVNPPPATVAAPARPAVRPAAPPRAPLRLLTAETAADEQAAGGTFEGRVVSATSGQGVARAELTFDRGGAATSITTAADGSFRFAPAAPGVYALASATAEGFLPFAPEWGQSPIVATLAPGTRLRDVTIALTPAVVYTGVVQDPAGRPVAGAEVRIVEAGGADAALAPLPDRFTSDARGEFRFRAPDDALLEARHPEWAPGRARLRFGAQVSHRLVIRLRVREAAELAGLAGRVVGADGAPVAGATVLAEHRPAPTAAVVETPRTARAITDDGGGFAFSALAPGDYDVAAAADVRVSARVRAPAGARDVVLRLGAAARLRGTVRGEGGAPVVAFAVILTPRRGPLEGGGPVTRTFFDARGAFAVDGLAPGAYAVRVVAHGFAPAPARDVPIAAPETAADFTLGAGARITGVVLEAGTRTPLAGANVAIEGAWIDELPLAARVVTDATGAFSLGGVPAGRCSLRVAASGHHGRILGGLTVAPPASLGPVTVELTRVDPGEEPRLELVGIGAVLAARDDALVIGELTPAGGGAAAGLVPGDAVLKVEGQPVVDLGFQEAIQLIRGPEGTTVVLTVRRAGGAVVEVPVLRKPIRW